MKLFTQKRKMFLYVMVGLLMVLMARTVWAGGWAEIVMNKMPEEIHAGESVQLDFMVYRHGETPVHFLGDPGLPVVPLISGTNIETGETIEFTAVPVEGEVGRFLATVTFPTEGEWTWTISPDPLEGTTNFEPLTILPEMSAPVTEVKVDGNVESIPEVAADAVPSTGSPAFAPWAAVILVFTGLALLGFAISRRGRQIASVVDSGD